MWTPDLQVVCGLGRIVLVLRLLSHVASHPTSELHRREVCFSAIVAFGDSFTDNGNGSWILSNKSWPADPNYYDGRFSNGPVWIDYVAANLSTPLYDYAIGGATSSNSLVQGYTGPRSTIPVPSIHDQVSSFIDHPSDDVPTGNPLFILFGGANDILFNPNVTAAQTYREIMASRSALAARFPTATFLVLNYPDLSRLPYGFYTDRVSKHELRSYTRGLGSLYRRASEDRAATPPRTAFVGLRELFDRWDYYAEPLDYGFDPLGAYGSCLVGAYGETEAVSLCPVPDARVFWDEYHPTARAHSFVAEKVLDVLGSHAGCN